MSYLVRFDQDKPHHVAHLVHTINGVEGALCSHTPQPAAGDQSRNGVWELVETLPPDVRLCHVCQKIQHKLDNPLPLRVEKELAQLAFWDARAAERQRLKMLAFYREKQLRRKRPSSR